LGDLKTYAQAHGNPNFQLPPPVVFEDLSLGEGARKIIDDNKPQSKRTADDFVPVQVKPLAQSSGVVISEVDASGVARPIAPLRVPRAVPPTPTSPPLAAATPTTSGAALTISFTPPVTASPQIPVQTGPPQSNIPQQQPTFPPRAASRVIPTLAVSTTLAPSQSAPKVPVSPKPPRRFASMYQAKMVPLFFPRFIRPVCVVF